MPHSDGPGLRYPRSRPSVLSELGCLCRLLNCYVAYPNISGLMSKRIDGPTSEGVALTWPLAQAGKWDKDCDSKCALTASKSTVQAFLSDELGE